MSKYREFFSRKKEETSKFFLLLIDEAPASTLLDGGVVLHKHPKVGVCRSILGTIFDPIPFFLPCLYSSLTLTLTPLQPPLFSPPFREGRAGCHHLHL